jgi:16S rRNA (uracil1498-N3)-methyltransferase
VLDLVTTKQLARLADGGRMLVLEPTAALALSELQLDDRDLILVVGPEGGISPQEIEALAAAGADIVRLGDEVLRTSTAGPAALAVLNVKLARW